MTQENLDAAIREIILPQSKPRNTQNSHYRKMHERRRLLRWITPDEFKNPDKYFFARFTVVGMYPSYWSRDSVYIFLGSLSFHYHGVCYYLMSGKFKLSMHCESRGTIKTRRLIRKIKRRQPRRFKGKIPSGAAYKKIKIKRPQIG